VRVLGGFWAFVLQFGAQRVDLGGEESILARIWLCFGRIWRADERGKARASGPAARGGRRVRAGKAHTSGRESAG